MKRMRFLSEAWFFGLYFILVAGTAEGIRQDVISQTGAWFIALGFVATTVLLEMWLDYRRYLRQIEDAKNRLFLRAD